MIYKTLDIFWGLLIAIAFVIMFFAYYFLKPKNKKDDDEILGI